MSAEDGPKGAQATTELMVHILQKGFQAGSLVGLGVVLPIVAFRRSRAGVSLLSSDFQTTAATSLTYSTLAGFCLTGLMGTGMIWGKPLDTEGIEDRAYRLRYNEGQLRTDLFSQVGALAGALSGYIGLRGISNPSLRACGAASLGCSMGVIAHIATMKPSQKPRMDTLAAELNPQTSD